LIKTPNCPIIATVIKIMADLVTIKDLSKHADQEVSLQGWIANKRSSGSIHFLILRDGTGFVQAILGKKDIDEETFKVVDRIGIESSVKVTGNVRKDERAPGGYELQLTGFELVSEAQNFPIAKKAHGAKFLLDNRHLWIRSQSQYATLKIRSEIIWALGEFFHQEGFVKFDGPMFTGNEVEGGSTLFEVEYFGKKAYLTQSSQLYGEAGAMAFGKVYTFGPTFRAEKSKTRRHLTEFWMLEPEVAFNDWKDNVALQQRMIHFVIKHCLENCAYELEILGRDVKKLENGLKPFLWLHHKDACRELQKAGLNVGDRDDLGADEEAALTNMHDEFIVLHHMPAEIKAFYMQPDLEEGDNRVLCNDLLGPEGYGEIIGGSQRIHDLDLLAAKIKEVGLDPEVFSWYMDLREYGSVPHAGFGIGLERLVRYVTGIKHIRNTIPFPRMINRLTP
jgi:asparaginyl-tRNA synthetase